MRAPSGVCAGVSRSAQTIAAIATPRGRGAVGIVRVSGQDLRSLVRALLGTLPEPRRAVLSTFRDAQGQMLDQGLAVYFPAPHSFTGEDVLELQGHGGVVVMDRLLERVLGLGARMARPGEFSERAFLNDKIDLAQAEAIADLIDSQTQEAARSALRSLRGEFSDTINALVDGLTELRILVEAALDFPDEEVDQLADGELLDRATKLKARLCAIFDLARQGSLLREGMRLVIAGRPNVGKSTLLNRLAGHEAAIVTEIPGTTRDVLRLEIELEGMPVHVIDTAGLRASTDPVEAEGIRRAWAEMAQADLILLVHDLTTEAGEEDRHIEASLPPQVARLRVWNKVDRISRRPVPEAGDILLSAKTGEGLDLLRSRLKARMGYHEDGEGVFMARRRHLTALSAARAHMAVAAELLGSQREGELVAEELRLAQQALGEITGAISSDELLGRIFSSFCIGK